MIPGRGESTEKTPAFILGKMIENIRSLFSEHGRLFLWLGGISLVFFLGTLAAVPVFLGRIGPEFFLLPPRVWRNRNFFDPVLFVFWFLLKNLLGTVFLLVGILMLFTPGQGVLTMILGLIFLSFPGKKKLLRYLLSKKRIRRVLNWIRNKTGKPPFIFEERGL